MQQRNLVLILARDLADKLASAVFVVDADGRIVYFNQHAEEILGRTFADIGGGLRGRSSPSWTHFRRGSSLRR